MSRVGQEGAGRLGRGDAAPGKRKCGHESAGREKILKSRAAQRTGLSGLPQPVCADGKNVADVVFEEETMRVLYWRIIAVAVLIAGALGGCGGPTVADLQQQVDEATKKRDEAKGEFTQAQSELVGCQDSKRVFEFTSNAVLEKLKKENAELKAKLGQ